MAKSLLDHAFDYVEANVGGVSFKDLWAYVVETAELTSEVADSKVARFYTNLMLDGRFVTLGDNIWDLRVRNTFDKANRIDPEVLYADSEPVTYEDNAEKEDVEDIDTDADYESEEEPEEDSEEEKY